MSEEASNAAKVVPFGMIMATGICWILGFIVMIVIAACIDQNLSNVLGSSFGQPMAQIYFDAVGKKGALGMNFSKISGIVAYHSRADVTSLHRSIHDGTFHPCRRFSSIVGFLERWCTPVFVIFSPYLEAVWLVSDIPIMHAY